MFEYAYSFPGFSKDYFIHIIIQRYQKSSLPLIQVHLINVTVKVFSFSRAKSHSASKNENSLMAQPDKIEDANSIQIRWRLVEKNSVA